MSTLRLKPFGYGKGLRGFVVVKELLRPPRRWEGNATAVTRPVSRVIAAGVSAGDMHRPSNGDSYG